MKEVIDVEFRADTDGLETALKNLEDRSKQFGAVLTNALKGAATSGKSLEDTLRQVALSLAGTALDAGLKPLQNLLGNTFSSIFSGVKPFAKGGMTGGVQAFGSGGIVSAPTFFPNGSQLGLMGEAGAEAIMPLQRGSDGRLGVAMAGVGGASQSVTVNISTPDATSFVKSQAQISAIVARAANRGSRYI